MALTIASPTDGTLPIHVKIGGSLNGVQGGALAATPLPTGVVVAQPTDGVLPILGAVVMGQVANGVFVFSLP